MRVFLIAVVIAACAACTDNAGATRLLANEGYKNITLTGYKGFACGRGDNYATGFEATNLAGNRVKGVVCSGAWMKGSTIRFTQ